MDLLNVFLNSEIVKTNLFNFLIVVGILVFCAVKFDLKSLLVSMQEKIAQTIEEVKSNKEKSEKTLAEAKDAVKNLNSDIEQIKDDAQNSAKMICEKILNDAKTQVESISLNADKVILAEEKQLAANLIKEVSKASVQKSKENIISMLENNNEMHEKYINESIDKLDGLKL